MTNEQIKDTIEQFEDDGGIRVRDIAYILLSHMFDDSKTAYKCLFGNEDGFVKYVGDEMREKLEAYMTDMGYIRSMSTDDYTGGISFEENKGQMVAMISRIEKDMTDGMVDRKDGYSLIKDIRTKLNDKFKVEAKKQDRMIIVEKKFDFVCPYTRHECYQLDKEDAMKKWNLIENKTINDGRTE